MATDIKEIRSADKFLIQLKWRILQKDKSIPINTISRCKAKAEIR